ncbi:MAG: glycosyltransferase family 39 protein [Chloroflexota bacterium]
MQKPSTQHSPVRWRWVIAAALILALDSEVSGGFLGLTWLSAMSAHLQILLFCIAIACLIYAFAEKPLLSIFHRAPTSQQESLSPSTQHSVPSTQHLSSLITRHSLLITLFLFALLLRLWHNGAAIHTLVDEMNFVSGMTNFWKPDPVLILTPMDNISPYTWLFPYLQANFVAVFGRNMEAIRAVSALVGALNIPALYLLAVTLFNRKTALVAAFLLAVFPPHIHFSRIALNQIADPLIGTLALAFLARGLKYQRRLDYALAGIFLGLTQYFFEGGRLLYIPLAAIWFITVYLFVRPDETVGARHVVPLRKIGYTILCTLLLAAPVYYTLFAIHKPLTGRMDASGLDTNFWNTFNTSPFAGGLNYLVNHLSPSIRVYALLPDATRYYGGHTALILPLLVPFFVIGLLIVLRYSRSAGNLLLLLWILAVSLGNSLLLVSSSSTHYVVVFPALALIIALGLCATLDWLPKRFSCFSFSPSPSHGDGAGGEVPLTENSSSTQHSVPSTQHFSFTCPSSLIPRPFLLIITILFLLAVYQLAYYFGPHLANFDAEFRETRPNHDIEDAVYRSLDFPPNTQVHIIGLGKFDVGYGLKFAYFFRDDLPTDSDISANLTRKWVSNLPRNVDQAFFFETEDIDTLELLQATFKSALEGPFFSPYNVAPQRQYVLFYVRRVP